MSSGQGVVDAGINAVDGGWINLKVKDITVEFSFNADGSLEKIMVAKDVLEVTGQEIIM